jgi:ubiquinone biosynthesis monooxygenase Coq7
MAVNIYRFQITQKNSDHNRQLIAAMCNEMTHVQDFQVKLVEYGWKPSKLRWIHWIVGSAIGLASRLMGTQAILRADIWLESRAVHGYGELLQTVDWDDDTRAVIELDQADEVMHITRWQRLLRSTQRGGTGT